MSLALVIGGTRSGKSAHAERIALASGRPVRYVATGDTASLGARVADHVARRPAAWETVEAGDDLAGAIGFSGCVLVDGLGAWIAGVLHRAGAFCGDATATLRAGAHVREQIERVASAGTGAAEVIVVAEEAGSGVLPEGAASRAWLDLLGEATQRLAAGAASVELVVAGRPLRFPSASVELAAAGRSLRLPSASLATGSTGPAAAATARDERPATRRHAPAPHDGAEGLRHHGDRDARGAAFDHAVNVLDGGPPDWLREALARALADDATRYPDETDATAALAALHGREPDEIVTTNGAAEALWLLPAALRPGLAVCLHPGFTESEAALRAHAVAVARVLRDPDAGFALDAAAVPAGADLVIVGNPASPSGTLEAAAAVLGLRRPGRVVVVDEAFMSLVPGEPGSLAGERLDDVIVVRSLTKVLGVPGLRAGYAIAPAPLAARLRAVRPPWSANALALAALRAAAERRPALAAAAARAAGERADLAARLSAIPGVRSWPSATNFCLVEVVGGPAVVVALRARGIAVRPAGSFPGLGPGHLRITARDPARNARLAAALVEALG